MTSGNPASNFGLGPKSCRTCSPMSIALRPQRPHFKIEMAGQLVHPDKIQTAARKIWLIDSKYAVNCRWFWREINQPINQSSQMPPAPTPIQATVRSPHRRAIQKAVRCHAAEQVNLIRATDLIFNCNNKFMTMWKFQLWIADKETRLQQTVHWWSPWSSRWNAGASPTQAKKEQPRPFPHICHYISFYLIWLNLARQDPNLTNWMNWLNWFLARCSWGAPSWMWARKPLPRPILLWGPFPLACLRWSSWWALHWQNWTVIKNGLKHMFSSEFSSLTRQKTVKTKVLHWE